MPSHTRTILSHLRNLTAPMASDAALLGRWREQQDETAFTALVARHGPMVLGVCRRVLGDVQYAEDAFQATFLVLARKAASVRRPEALASFLYGVALRLARKARGAAQRRRTIQSQTVVPEPADPHPHPLDVLSGRELLALLDAEVARLPEVYRLPLLLCVLQGRTVEEAARTLGWSIGSLRGRLARGRERLRERLTRRGLDLSAGTLVLLAPAVVHERLLAAAVRNLAVPTSAAINGLLRSAPMLKLKMVCLGLLVVTAVGVGAGLPLLRAPVPETPPAVPSAAPPSQAKHEPRRDRYGDPLPTGAVARLGTLRFRAPGEVVALAFAPDGKTVAVSAHGGLFLMDPVNGKRIKSLPKVTDFGNGTYATENPILFSPDGKSLISRGHKVVGHSLLPVVRVWKLAGERKPREFDIGPNVIWSGWSAKGQPLAIRVEQGMLHLHDLSAGQSRRFTCKEPLKNPVGTLSDDPAVACSPSGKTLAVVDDKNAIHIWDTATGRERRTLPAKGQVMYSLTFSPDGNRLLSTTPQAVQMWDVATAKALFAIDAKETYGAAVFTSDGKTLAILDSWRTIRFWDAATGQERGRTQGKHHFAAYFAFSPDGQSLVTADRSGSALHLWDVATGKQKPQPVGHTNRPYGMAFSPDGRRVATGGSTEGDFRFWDVRTGEPLHRLSLHDWARACAFSLDGRTLFASWADDWLRIYDADTREQKHVIKLEDPDHPDTVQYIISMRLSDDGKTLVAFSCYYAKKNGARLPSPETLITGWDASTRKQLFRHKRPGTDSWLVLSADARVLATASPQGRDLRFPPGQGPMWLEDVRTGERLLTFPTLKGQTWPLAFSPDGRLLGRVDVHRINSWYVKSYIDELEPSQMDASCWQHCSSGEERQHGLASNNFYRPESDKDGKTAPALNTLRLWETMTASEVLSLPAADFDRVAFSLDGRLLAVAAPAQEIVVWDLAYGREQRRFKGFDAEVIDLAFSPDGRRLISSLADSTLLVWDVRGRETRSAKLGAEAVTKAWSDLATTDAPRAFRARGTLVFAPEEALPLLKDHLRPVKSPEPQRLRRLLTDLESDVFAVREKAQAALEELGELAETTLRQTLAAKPTLEVRRRVQALLERLRGPVTRPEMLCSLRAVAVLEDIATPPARRLLEELAKGVSEARLTREAKASLLRLGRSRPE